MNFCQCMEKTPPDSRAFWDLQLQIIGGVKPCSAQKSKTWRHRAGEEKQASFPGQLAPKLSS